MCKWGDSVEMHVPVSARKSHTGKKRWKWMPVDACLAPIVQVFLDAGIETEECCCGHGKSVGYLALADDRCFVLANGKEEWDVARDAIEQYRKEMSNG